MSEWISFLHAPRENFAETMTPDEQTAFGAHAARLERLLDEGTLILAGPTLGTINTGIAVFEAPDEAAAQHPRRGPGGAGGHLPRRAPALPRRVPSRSLGHPQPGDVRQGARARGRSRSRRVLDVQAVGGAQLRDPAGRSGADAMRTLEPNTSPGSWPVTVTRAG
jgi:hypothetical protein